MWKRFVLVALLSLPMIATPAAADQQPFSMTVGTIATGDLAPRVLIVIHSSAPDAVAFVTSLSGPDGSELVPKEWYPKEIQGQSLTIIPTLQPALPGEYTATLDHAAGTELTATLQQFDWLVLPIPKQLDASDGMIDLEWEAVAGAIDYSVAILSTSEQPEVIASEAMTGTSVQLRNLQPGLYTLILRAYSFAVTESDAGGIPADPKISEYQTQVEVRP